MMGHDGSEILWPEMTEPYCRRSFHIQELIGVADTLGYACTPFEACPCIRPEGASKSYDLVTMGKRIARMDAIMSFTKGVCIGYTKGGQPHAVAWSGDSVYDPCGAIYKREEFMLESFWKIKSF